MALLVACLAIAVLVVIVARRAGVTLSLDDAPSSRLLTTLANAAGLARPAGPLRRTPEEGTLADTADRDYVVPSLAAARTGIAVACAAQGLASPSGDERQLMPDIVCAGRWRDRSATVHLDGQCTGDACRVVLEVRVS